ncbi:hypothetical protein LOTGIDRAFT_114992 [Lottia gigantea]|uniref:NACHT domain-containing protein n=1 Tax=Lottia gigantea TaxID=225164 RepID=V4AR66_LOTGI|nr:hypothetical protein LOTGIDRAFT_114992 [Lottia gigantea]ESO97320.1 hypothetical protein LOTGIDRAFT_114992 [Lottia gigantea]
MVKKASDLFNSNLDNYTEEILRGKISVECPPTAKIVRIFTSSTFTDTRHERNYLMEKIYPKLKEFCQNLGYEFQVVDMRWGVRDEATDDHMTTELCLKEVDLCNKISTGPSFVTFLSHKYGYRDLQREIEAGEFEKLYDAARTDKVKNLLSRWFTRDDNSVPPTYILQPISSRIPEFISEVEDEKSKAKNLWNSERDEMRQGLVQAAQQILDSESSHKYVRSVTETEIDRGLINGENAVIQNIRDYQLKLAGYAFSLSECFGTEEYIQESHKLLTKLSEQKLRSKIPTDHILTYPIHWTNKGIDPVSDKAHKLYIEKLGNDFEKTIKNVMEAIVQKEVDLINTPLYQEVFQHIIFCQEKCKAFHGREETFHIIQEYMNDPKIDEPLIVHGESGSGKTSIMAMAVKNAWSTEVHQTTIIRFLGTTPDSSNIGSLLLSVINQIRTVYNQDLIKPGMTLKELANEFENTLDLAMEERPLLVVLDSLDQLDITGGARQLSWLPSKLPKHVKMIVSTLPEPEYECFPRLQVSVA